MTKINDLLKEYIYTNIIPQYKNFDKAHNLDHINDVLTNSLEISQTYEVDVNIVFTIAAYHDIGIKFGRKNHHITSAELMMKDTVLQQWFTDDKLTLIKEAIEDHRASNDYEPRTIYGKIISEADRLIDPETIIYRTVEYGKFHFPNLSYDEHFERVYLHIEEKYGKNGYLKLWLKTTKNTMGLQKLQSLLKDRERMKEIYSNYA